MSSGWDDGSAYGYNHVIDDPTLTLTLTPTLTRYTLSYVPYGQAAARSLLRRALKRAGVELPAGATASTGRVAPAGLAAVAEAGEGS